jgi:hypothetical protein
MNRLLYALILLVFVTSCKSDKKVNQTDGSENGSEAIIDKKETPKLSTFESKLIDLRNVDVQLTENIKVEKFGMQKVNDSIFGFVFRLNNATSRDEIELYSFGIRGFSPELDKPYAASFAPQMTMKNEDKYVILTRKIENTRYFDSIDVYIYERKNWKKSGRLGEFVIRDILFE